MNFLDISISGKLREELTAMEKSRRIPHAVIITGGSEESRDRMCKLLSMWAVCRGDGERPCAECSQCKKAESGSHIDIYYAKGSGKTDVIAVEEIRNITRDTAIIPNEAEKKVYVLRNADKRMGAEALNAFLKTLEEPTQDILFLLTAESPKVLPETIRSRCTVLSLDADNQISEEVKALADDILTALPEVSEMPLMKALSALSTKQTALEVLPRVRGVLSDALALSVGGDTLYDSELATVLRRKLTKSNIIALIDTISNALSIINRNVNMSIITTWLCAEIRRNL